MTKPIKTINGGLLIVFEGLDGVGKTTQIEKAKETLVKDNWQVYSTKNLGGTLIGEELRRVMKMNIARPAMTDLYLSLAVQEALKEVLLKQKGKGSIILLDRSPLSLVVYQAYGDDVNKDLAWQWADEELKQFKPDLVLYYELDLESALKRLKAGSRKLDYFDSKPNEYFERIETGYKEAIKRHNITLIPADGSIAEVHHLTMLQIEKTIKDKIKA